MFAFLRLSFFVDYHFYRIFEKANTHYRTYTYSGSIQLQFIEKFSVHGTKGIQTVLVAGRTGFRADASFSKLYELTGVNGLVFKVYTTVRIAVKQTFPLSDLFHNTAYFVFLQGPTNRSQTLLKWGDAFGLRFQMMACWITCSSIPFCSVSQRSLKTVIQLHHILCHFC